MKPKLSDDSAPTVQDPGRPVRGARRSPAWTGPGHDVGLGREVGNLELAAIHTFSSTHAGCASRIRAAILAATLEP
jgi:hypothetical protein